MASNVPAKIGKYDVIDVIGRGGMGVVYKAIDPHLDRQVAIKMMTSGFVDNPDLLKRFFREAQSLGSLQHPNVVTVYDLGDFAGNPYMVMEFMEGEGLDTVLAGRRQLSALEKTNIIVEVCNGLSYAHGRGIVHRDIKPANIMLSKDGGVKLFDFGIAHIGDHSVTKTGQMVGTLSYMSPEQVNSEPVDARTDLFSTGVVLYQLFTNHLPFEGKNTATTLLKIVNDPPPPLKNFLSSYPPELETILARALAKDREQRYHSADEFALDLTQLRAQLKQELVGQHMQEVGRLLERSDLYKAKEYLIQVLKVDQRHGKATQLLREVQAQIKKEELGEQVRKLQQRAVECAAREQFETAQEFVEQALAIDKTNTELPQLRESLKAAALRAQTLHSALRRAETSHQDGELDTAKQAIEEALEIARDDPQVKTLNRVIQRDWTERSRQRQLANYLFEARQEISSRKFTAALEILKLAEELDPHAPQVHALIESAAAGRDQERRRRDLEAISRDIEDALNRDDYRAACQKADEGLARFPEERTLVKLKALADRQRQIEERKQFIDEQLAVSRKLLQEGRNEELLTLLEEAVAKIGVEPRLQSLLTIVKENVQRKRLELKKIEFLQKAKVSLRNKSYDSAIHTLEGARSELRNEPEIDDLLQFVREEAASERRRRIAEAAAEKAHAFIAQQKYEDAIRLLESTLRETPDEELRIALSETRQAAVEYQQKLDATVSAAEKLLQARKANEALRLLESQPTAYFRDPALAKILESAQNETERLRKEELLEQKRIRAKQEEQRRTEGLEQQRQGVIPQEEKDQVDSEKHRPEQQHAEQPRSCQEDRPQQAKLKREALVPFGSVTNATRLFGTETPTQNRRAESPISFSSPQKGGPADQKTESSTGTSINVVGWDPAILHAIETELAVFVGPLARIFVKKGAAKTTDPEMLYLLLAESLEREGDRVSFLARKSVLSKKWPLKVPQAPTDATSTAFAQSSPAEFSSEALDRASRLIAEHVGPIAKVLVRKEARQAGSLRALYLRLAEHVQDPSERARFIHDAGF